MGFIHQDTGNVKTVDWRPVDRHIEEIFVGVVRSRTPKNRQCSGQKKKGTKRRTMVHKSLHRRRLHNMNPN